MSHVYSLAKVLALEKISGIDRSNKKPLVKDLEDKDEGLSGLLKGEGWKISKKKGWPFGGIKRRKENRRREEEGRMFGCFYLAYCLEIKRRRGSFFFWVAESSQGTRVDLSCFIFEGSQESKKKGRWLGF